MVLAGTVGSSGLPATAEAHVYPAADGVPAYTTISNKGALKMVETN